MPSATPQQILDEVPCYACQPEAVLQSIGTVGLSGWWADTLGTPVESAQATMSRAGCRVCLSRHELLIVQTAILAEILEALVPGTDTSPDAVMARAGCFACISANEMAAIRASQLTAILALLDPAADTSPQALMDDAACMYCLSPHEHAAIQNQLFGELLESIAPGTDSSPSAVMSRSGCYACLIQGMLNTIQTVLLVELAEAIAAAPCVPPVLFGTLVAFRAATVDPTVDEATLLLDGNGSNAKYKRDAGSVALDDGVNTVIDNAGVHFTRMSLLEVEASDAACVGARFATVAALHSVTVSSAFDEIQLTQDANGNRSWFYRNVGSVAPDDGVNTVIDSAGVHFTRLFFT